MSAPHNLKPIAHAATLATYGFMLLQCSFSLFLFYDNSVYSAYLANETGQAEIDALNALDAVYVVVSLGFILCSLVIFSINGRWIYLASTNAALASPSENRITPGWAVGWYFVPIANLWKPLEAMKEIWMASVGRGSSDSTVPGWITLWWITWVLLNLSDRIAGQYGTGLDAPPEQYMAGNTFTAITGFLWIIPAYMFVRLIREITAAQGSAAEVFA